MPKAKPLKLSDSEPYANLETVKTTTKSTISFLYSSISRLLSILFSHGENSMIITYVVKYHQFTYKSGKKDFNISFNVIYCRPKAATKQLHEAL